MSFHNHQILLVVSKIEALEGAVFGSLRCDDATPIIYCLQENRFIVPGDSRDYRAFYPADGANPLLCRHEIEQLCESYNIGITLCVGIDAAAAFLPMRPRGLLNEVLLTTADVEKPKNRTNRARRLKVASNNTNRIYFDSQHAFNFATERGLDVQYFLADIDPHDRSASTRILASNSKTIGVVVPSTFSAEQIRPTLLNIRKKLPDYGIRVIQDQNVYDRSDMIGQQDLQMSISNELQDFSHLLFLGTSRNTLPILRCLPHDFDRIVVQDSVALRRTLWGADGNFNLSPNSSLIEHLIAKVTGLPQEAGSLSNCPDRGTPLVEHIRRIATRDLPPFYEDLICLRDSGPLDIYFSVTPVTDGSNGARVQRVRNMFFGFQQANRNMIDIFSNPLVIERRYRLILYLMEQGRELGILYAENSTSPIPHIRTLLDLEILLNLVREKGQGIAWFIRDLHFMYQDIWHGEEADNMVSRAKLEFQLVSENADIFYTPTKMASKEFKDLLPPQERPETRWLELPPGMRTLKRPNINLRPKRKISFVYSGGLGAIYPMQLYLNAVKKLSHLEDVGFDFVIREKEGHYLEKLGIQDSDNNIRIQHEDFDYYEPDAEYNVGIALLESRYTDNAFPFKIMNYVSQYIPVLCYDAAYIGHFMKEYDVGKTCIRTESGVESALNSLIDSARNQTWPFKDAAFANCWAQNSWKQRSLQVLSDLDNSRLLTVKRDDTYGSNTLLKTGDFKP